MAKAWVRAGGLAMWWAPAGPPEVHAGFPAWSSAPTRRPLPNVAAAQTAGGPMTRRPLPMHTGDTERTGSTYTEEYGSAVHRSAYDEVYGFAENAVYSSGYNEVLVHGSAYTEAAPRYAYEGAYGSTM